MKMSKQETVTPAMEETLRLSYAWIAYLLKRLGEDPLRVDAADLKNALETLSCGVCKDGDAYVITLSHPEAQDG